MAIDAFIEEGKLPKSERSYNYYTHQLSLIKQELKQKQMQYEKLSKESECCSIEIDRLLNKQLEISKTNEELEQ
ncbi:hypothetical protein FR265_04535 [Vibrio vulnificus]|nr:hypothetical protein [Vibrio vulnificus]